MALALSNPVGLHVARRQSRTNVRLLGDKVERVERLYYINESRDADERYRLTSSRDKNG